MDAALVVQIHHRKHQVLGISVLKPYRERPSPPPPIPLPVDLYIPPNTYVT